MVVKTFDYVTQKGDTFDILALDAYNDEFKADVIIDENPKYSDVLVFDEGIILRIPILENMSAETLPPWRR